jgi:hypothetical protein
MDRVPKKGLSLLSGRPQAPDARASAVRWQWRCAWVRAKFHKPRITGHQPKRLAYAQADRAISALAAHFAESGRHDERRLLCVAIVLSSSATAENESTKSMANFNCTQTTRARKLELIDLLLKTLRGSA